MLGANEVHGYDKKIKDFKRKGIGVYSVIQPLV